MASDERLGIVRLELPDGRSVPLQLTYRALDAVGHQGLVEHLQAVRKGKQGSGQALAALLDTLSAGAIKEADVLASPAAAYPVTRCIKACWEAWELGQHGPDGRPASEAPENPRSQRPTLWARLTSWRVGSGSRARSSGA